MLKKWALVFGILFLAVGVLGFVPAVSPNGMLLGVFHVNTAHNIVHLVTGAVAFLVGFCNCGKCAICVSGFTPKLFFQVFGVVYLAVALLGFWHGDAPVLGVIANNFADSLLHTGIAVVSLYLGFVHKE